MAKQYEFKVLIADSGRVYVTHNCEGLVEFLGVLEMIKAIGMKMFSVKQEKIKNEFDPEEYLRRVQENTKMVKISGIASTFKDKD
jgi:hypothetical protein